MKKLIFLDLDGVLRPLIDCDPEVGSRLCPHCIANWNRLIERTDAKVVISSAWRGLVLRGDMTLRGFYIMLCTHDWTGDIVGVTPCLAAGRSDEIAAYLKENPCDRYVVIDDMPQAGIGHTFIQTNPRIGLTRLQADRAVEILERQCRAAA